MGDKILQWIEGISEFMVCELSSTVCHKSLTVTVTVPQSIDGAQRRQGVQADLLTSRVSAL